jgi:hypothetical protein
MIRIARKHVVGAALAATFAAAAFAAISGAATSSAHHYVLRTGDAISVPSLRWSCLVAKVPPNAATPTLVCTTDGKPVRAVNVASKTISVSTGVAPVRRDGTYTFTYRP